MKYSSGILSGMVKPKYVLIKNLIGEDFDYSHGVDIFIDLNTFINSMCSSTKYLSALPFDENPQTDMMSSLIHILLHWKNFSRRWDDVRIFLLMNDFNTDSCYEQQHLRSYLSAYKFKFENNSRAQLKYHLNETLTLLQKILQFVPKSYLIKCDKCDAFVIPHMIDDYENNERKRIIVTGNNIFTGYMFEKETKVIFSKCRNTGVSQVYDPLMVAQSIAKVNDDIIKVFISNKVYYNLLNIIIGDPDRAILGTTNTGTTRIASSLLRNLEKNLIPKNPKTIDAIISAIDPQLQQYVKHTYPLIDVKSHANMIPPSYIEKIKSEQMIDKIDIDGLNSFSIDGVNLIELI